MFSSFKDGSTWCLMLHLQPTNTASEIGPCESFGLGFSCPNLQWPPAGKLISHSSGRSRFTAKCRTRIRAAWYCRLVKHRVWQMLRSYSSVIGASRQHEVEDRIRPQGWSLQDLTHRILPYRVLSIGSFLLSKPDIMASPYSGSTFWHWSCPNVRSWRYC